MIKLDSFIKMLVGEIIIKTLSPISIIYILVIININ